jgi:hypothetical protein
MRLVIVESQARVLTGHASDRRREEMLIGAVIAICVLLAILGFLLPVLSNHARRGSDRGFSIGQRAGSKAPGPVGRLLGKSFGKSRRAAGKSHSSGQRARSKLPF